MQDAVHPFGEPLIFFSETYRFEGLISVPSVHKRVIILKYVRVDGTEVAVRCLPDGADSEKELRVLHRVEDMRKRLGLACVVRFHGYCNSQDPFQLYDHLLTTQLKWEPHDGPYWNIIMDYVPVAYNQLDEDYMADDDEPVVAFLVDLLYTLWQARVSAQFFHGDLHTKNIMFAPLEKGDARRTRHYTVAGMRLTVRAAYLPVMIDFEKSKFGTADPKENMSDVRNTVTAMGHIMEEYSIKWSSEFLALRSHVLSFSFVDTRFTPDTIVRILHDFALFDGVRDKEAPPKKIKGCLHCGNVLADQACSQCGALLCSSLCSRTAWRGPEACHME